jgi:hypothetical protein
VHEWTIEAGEGPAAVILDGPDELTNQTEATFTIEAPGATRLECSLNDGDAEGCRALAVFEVDEGENTLVVRGFAGDTPGAPATYRWTVDTTPPEVKIDAVTFTHLRRRRGRRRTEPCGGGVSLQHDASYATA